MDKAIGDIQKTLKLLEDQYYETSDPESKEKIRKKLNSLNKKLEKLIRSQLDGNDPKYREFARKLAQSGDELAKLKKELARYQTAFSYLSDIFKGINYLIRKKAK